MLMLFKAYWHCTSTNSHELRTLSFTIPRVNLDVQPRLLLGHSPGKLSTILKPQARLISELRSDGKVERIQFNFPKFKFNTVSIASNYLPLNRHVGSDVNQSESFSTRRARVFNAHPVLDAI